MNRSIWIDLVRVVGIFFVIISHTSGRVAGGYAVYEADSADLGLAGLISSCFHLTVHSVAVPLFIMISGALLLGRSEPILTFYKKRFGKVLLPFAVWCCIFIFCLRLVGRTFQDGSPITFANSIWAILTCNITGHFWFIYLILTMYLLAPFISACIRNISKNTLSGVMMLWLITFIILPTFTIVPAGGYLSATTLQMTTSADIAAIAKSPLQFIFDWLIFFIFWIGFFVMGYVLKNTVIPTHWALIAIGIWFCLSVSIPINGYLLRNAAPDSAMALFCDFMRSYILPIIASRVILALLAILILRSLGNVPADSPALFSRFILAAAPLTFGVFYCHHLFLIPVMESGSYLGTSESWLFVLCVIPALALFFHVVSGTFVYLVQRSKRLRPFLAP